LPLFELVYHDAVVSTFWWNDLLPSRVPEQWARVDLLNMLYGTVPVWILTGWYAEEFFYLNLDRFIQSYNNVCRWAQVAGYDEMTDHQLLTPDGDVQRSSFSSGYTITVNFAATPHRLRGGTELPGSSYLITGKPHPNLTFGRPVRFDPDWKPIDPDFEQVCAGRTSGWMAAPGIGLTATESDVAPRSAALEIYLKRLNRMRKIGHEIVLHQEASGHFSGTSCEKSLVRTRKFKILPGTRYRFRGWIKLKSSHPSECTVRFAIELFDVESELVAVYPTVAYDVDVAGWQELEASLRVLSHASSAHSRRGRRVSGGDS